MPSYKYCIVPKCVNTTAVTPNKLFFQVPQKADLRKKWFKAMKKNDTNISEKARFNCCEDHFDVEEDLANYTRYKMMGGRLILKKGVLPHKFDCQKVTVLVEMSAYKKQKQIQRFERVLKTNIRPENVSEVPIEFVKCEPNTSNDTEREPNEIDHFSTSSSSHTSSKTEEKSQN